MYSFQEQNLINNSTPAAETRHMIAVHVAGEVNSPGIITVEEGARVKEVIEKAGGTTENADLRKVNFAYIVKDEQKVVIPNYEETKKNEELAIIDESEEFIQQDYTSGGGKVNINKATQTELEQLTGVGPSMASKILAFRKENGKFSTIEDIKNVPGIGSAKFEAIKNEICVK